MLAPLLADGKLVEDRAMSNPQSPTATRDRTVTRITKSNVRRTVGISARPHRIREIEAALHDEEALRSGDPKRLAEFREKTARALKAASPGVRKEWEALKPSFRAPPRATVVGPVEIFEARRIPQIAWLEDLMTRRLPEGRRPEAARFTLAVLQMMVMVTGLARVWAALQPLRGDLQVRWAFGFPSVKPWSTVYDSIGAMAERVDERVFNEVNIDLIRDLAEFRSPDGELVYPKVCHNLCVDGMFIEADLRQAPFKGPAERAVRASQYPDAEFVIHEDENGNIRLKGLGWTEVTLTCMDLTIVVCKTRIPGSAKEPEALLKLLPILFEAWPDCPVENIVGDSAYDHSTELARELELKLGIHPVFVRWGTISAEYKWAETEGRPACPNHGPMNFFKRENLLTAAVRKAAGVPRGVAVKGVSPRIRWKCAHCGTEEYTRPADNPRLYTWWPRNTEHPFCYKRIALALRRNSVESTNAVHQHLGFGGKGVNRLRLKGTAKFALVSGLAMVMTTARRYVHATGAYQDMLPVADHLGVLDDPTDDDPQPFPTHGELTRLSAELLAPVIPKRPRFTTAPDDPI
jgi:hypothetical protein